jgi:hypothetical protein
MLEALRVDADEALAEDLCRKQSVEHSSDEAQASLHHLQKTSPLAHRPVPLRWRSSMRNIDAKEDMKAKETANMS